MKSYQLNMTTRTYFGKGCVEEALRKEKYLIGKKTFLIMTGSALAQLGYTEKIISWIESESASVLAYNRILPNPDIAEIRRAIKIGKAEGITSVIGFGGGSAIDAAKAIAVGMATDIDIEDYLIKGLTPPNSTLPIIAIPTTAGTGAELSKGAIISSREKNIKSGIRGEKVAPAVAIVDPTYTFSLPMSVTMEAGFDVFTHAIESYCSVSSNPFSDMLSEKAIHIVGEALPRLYKDLNDQESREMMSFASHIMGYNVRNVGNCLPHRMQYPIEVVTETSHGAGLIALYPAWIEYEYKVNPDRITQALEWLGANEGESAKDRMLNWLKSLEINRTITDLGNNIDAEELAGMVTGNLKNDKLAVMENILIKLYQESM